MFTGLVQQLGQVSVIERDAKGATLEVTPFAGPTAFGLAASLAL